MMERIVRLLFGLKLRWLMLIANLLGVMIAELLASMIYRWVEGEVTAGVHVAATLTVIMTVTPMSIAVHRLLAVLQDREQSLISANKQIDTKNKRFRSILEMSVALQSSDELTEFLQCTLTTLYRIYFDRKFAIIVHGTRANVVRNFAVHGLVDSEVDILLGLRGELIHQNYLPVQQALLQLPDNSDSRWTFYSLWGRTNRLIGTLIIKGPVEFKEEQEVMNVLVRQISVAAENKLLALELEKLASTDALTNAYNRGYLERELRNQILLSRSSPDVDFALFVIDVNGLKHINDTYGHEEGDRAIILVAKMLRRVSRESDVMARMGGDEFVLLCPGTSKKEASVLLERIREQERQAYIEIVRGDKKEKVAIKISIGLASSDEVVGERVMRCADDAMYQDKKAFYQSNEEKLD